MNVPGPGLRVESVFKNIETGPTSITEELAMSQLVKALPYSPRLEIDWRIGLLQSESQQFGLMEASDSSRELPFQFYSLKKRAERADSLSAERRESQHLAVSPHNDLVFTAAV